MRPWLAPLAPPPPGRAATSGNNRREKWQSRARIVSGPRDHGGQHQPPRPAEAALPAYGFSKVEASLAGFDLLVLLQQRNGRISANLFDQNVGTPSANYLIKRLGSLADARVLAKLPDQTRSQITASAWKHKKRG
jgi:hypothetical protein